MSSVAPSGIFVAVLQFISAAGVPVVLAPGWTIQTWINGVATPSAPSTLVEQAGVTGGYKLTFSAPGTLLPGDNVQFYLDATELVSGSVLRRMSPVVKVQYPVDAPIPTSFELSTDQAGTLADLRTMILQDGTLNAAFSATALANVPSTGGLTTQQSDMLARLAAALFVYGGDQSRQNGVIVERGDLPPGSTNDVLVRTHTRNGETTTTTTQEQ